MYLLSILLRTNTNINMRVYLLILYTFYLLLVVVLVESMKFPRVPTKAYQYNK